MDEVATERDRLSNILLVDQGTQDIVLTTLVSCFKWVGQDRKREQQETGQGKAHHFD